MKLKKDSDRFILIHFKDNTTDVKYSNVKPADLAYASKILEFDLVRCMATNQTQEAKP